MNTRTVRLIDKFKTLVAIAHVADEGAYFGGTVDLRSTPPKVRALFDEFEELVNDQVFSLADEIQAKIAALTITAIFDDGFEAEVKDLQVFPSAGDVSFRLVGSPAVAHKSA